MCAAGYRAAALPTGSRSGIAGGRSLLADPMLSAAI
jgi:hypothetical protein